MSGRKRRHYDPEDPRTWTKEKYIERLQSMGIGFHHAWRVDILRQLYLANAHKDVHISPETHDDPNIDQVSESQTSPSAAGPPPSHPEDDNSGLLQPPLLSADVAHAAVNLPAQRSNTPDVNKDSNGALLRETTSALRAATEALSSISQIMSKQQSTTTSEKKQNTIETAINSIQRTEDVQPIASSSSTDLSSKRIFYAEDLPKMDYVAPSIRKQIIEEIPNSSTKRREESNTMSEVITNNVELTATSVATKIEDHLIQTLGRWNSSCYTRYIRTPKSTIKEAQLAMIGD